jgi:putative tricarboxylic transport membrane protein
MKRYYFGSYLFLLLLGLFVCFEARKLEVGKIFNPGAGFFPFWLSVGLILVSVVLIIKSVFERDEPSSEFKGLWSGLTWKKNLFVLGALFLYVFLLEILGYMISTFLLILFLFRAIKAQRWIVMIAGSAFTSLSTYFLFKFWLQVQFPVGILGI